MRRIVIAALVAFVALGAVPVMAADTVYIIRHLEKAAGDDPPLSRQGAARADQLAELLARANIKALFATPTKRALQTAMPLAKELGLPVSDYDPRNVDALAAAVAAVNGPVLIVGHSNTVASLVARFGGEKPPELTEQEYGTLFVVHSGTAQVNRIPLN